MSSPSQHFTDEEWEALEQEDEDALSTSLDSHAHMRTAEWDKELSEMIDERITEAEKDRKKRPWFYE